MGKPPLPQGRPRIQVLFARLFMMTCRELSRRPPVTPRWRAQPKIGVRAQLFSESLQAQARSKISPPIEPAGKTNSEIIVSIVSTVSEREISGATNEPKHRRVRRPWREAEL